MFINLHKLAGTDLLGGSELGEVLLGQALSAIAENHPDEVVVIDFDGVSIATSSFLRSFILGLRAQCQVSRLDAPIVVSNANDVVIEELEELLNRSRDAMVACRSRKGKLADAKVIGVLDEMQAIALHAVLEQSQPVDANTLAQSSGDKSPTS